MDWWHSVLSELERFQVLIAGIFALAAGAFAYSGAVRQARAVVDADRERRLARQRSVAAALYAELANIAAVLHADAQHLRSTRVPEGRVPDLSPLDVCIFRADPSAIGELPSDEVFFVTQVYKLIIDLDQEYEKLRGLDGLPLDYPAHVAEQVDRVCHSIHKALHGIRETAGITEDQAKAVSNGWGSKGPA